MDAVTWPYALYAAAAVALTVSLAMTLNRHGKVFLRELFPGNPAIASAINSLLVTGFFMLNLGYGFYIGQAEPAQTAFDATQGLIRKLGVLLLSLGVIHFVNMAVFWRIRRNITETNNVPTPANAVVLPPPPAAEAPEMGEVFTWTEA